jgi:hypothetical protein
VKLLQAWGDGVLAGERRSAPRVSCCGSLARSCTTSRCARAPRGPPAWRLQHTDRSTSCGRDAARAALGRWRTDAHDNRRALAQRSNSRLRCDFGILGDCDSSVLLLLSAATAQRTHRWRLKTRDFPHGFQSKARPPGVGAWQHELNVRMRGRMQSMVFSGLSACRRR